MAELRPEAHRTVAQVIAHALSDATFSDPAASHDDLARAIVDALAGAGVHTVTAPELAERQARVGFDQGGLEVQARAWIDDDLVSYETQIHASQLRTRQEAAAKITRRHLEQRLLVAIAERLGFGQS